MKQFLPLLILISLFWSCNNDDDIIPASGGAVIDINVGGPTQPNQVFVDLSTDNQVVSNKARWDLAFYSGTEFVVFLNAASEVLARPIDKTDINEVTEADYENFQEQTDVDAIFSNLFNPPPYPEWLSESSNWIDEPDGDKTKTAIGQISTSGDQNLVYFINRGYDADKNARGTYIIKVTRSGEGYKLDYRSTDETLIKSVEIGKDANFNSIHFSFDDGIVDVQPTADLWDIAFTTYMEKLDAGGGLLIPYRFQDYVVQNTNGGVEVGVFLLDEGADVLTEFESFNLDNAATLDFKSDLNTIGANWRTVASPTPGSVTGVKEDRIYVIKDRAGNQYKLLFTQMLSTSGERGFPQITYELLQ